MSVEAKVKSIIAEQLGVGEDEIKAESAFIEDLGADSLDIVELVMAMEEEFEVEIPDEEAEHIKTVQDAINFINEQRSNRSSMPARRTQSGGHRDRPRHAPREWEQGDVGSRARRQERNRPHHAVRRQGAPLADCRRGEGVRSREFMDKKEARPERPLHPVRAGRGAAGGRDAGLPLDKPLGRRVGVIVGSGMGGLATLEETHVTAREKGHRRVNPFFIPSIIVNLAAGQISVSSAPAA